MFFLPVQNLVNISENYSNKTYLIQKLNTFFVLTKILEKTGYFLSDQTCVDNIGTYQNVLLFKHLYTNLPKEIVTNHINDTSAPLPTIDTVFKSSLVLQREVYEMFNQFFINGQDLRRLLTDYSLVGYPLCKSSPLIGTKVILYAQQNLKYFKVFLSQNLRMFNMKSTWETL